MRFGCHTMWFGCGSDAIRGRRTWPECTKCHDFFCNCDCDFLTQAKKPQRCLGPKSAFSPPKSLAISLATKSRKRLRFILRFFEEKSVPTSVWQATGTFAIENRGDLRLRFLVLSGRDSDVFSDLVRTCLRIWCRQSAEVKGKWFPVCIPFRAA